MTRPVVGFVGVGLMGWGMAKNIVEKGYGLRVIAHRKREAVDDLVKRGAVEVTSLKEMGEACSVVVLCVTGSPEVEATVAGLLEGAQAGLTIIDTSTSRPDVTERLAAALAKKGMTFIDAPLSRTPKHAWDGELTTYVGGSDELIDQVKPLLSTWASVIIPIGGPVGSAHAVKLINNLIGIGYAAIWSEAYSMIRKIGIKPQVLRGVVSNSGMNCGNFQNYSKFICEGDPDAHQFAMANCLKDLTYFNELANRHGAATLMSDGALQVLKLGATLGMGPRNIGEMSDVYAALNGQPLGPVLND